MADEKTVQKSDEKKRRGTGKKVAAGANLVRSRLASLVWLVAVVCALFLAVGALLTFDGKNAGTKNALVNWGIGAIAYLVAGKVLDRIIRP